MVHASTAPAPPKIEPCKSAVLDPYWANRDREAGSRRGEAHGPQGLMTAYEVSNWLQVPRILGDLQAAHGTQIRLVFPEPATTDPQASVIKKEQEAIQRFLRDNQSKPLGMMMVDMQEAVRASHSFQAYLRDPVPSIASAERWISAHLDVSKAKQHHFGVTELVATDAHSLSDTVSTCDLLATIQSATQKNNLVVITVPRNDTAQAALAEALSQWITDRKRSDASIDTSNIKVWIGPSEPRFGSSAGSHVPLTEIDLRSFLHEEDLKRRQRLADTTSIKPSTSPTEPAETSDPKPAEALPGKIDPSRHVEIVLTRG